MLKLSGIFSPVPSDVLAELTLMVVDCAPRPRQGIWDFGRHIEPAASRFDYRAIPNRSITRSLASPLSLSLT